LEFSASGAVNSSDPIQSILESIWRTMNRTERLIRRIKKEWPGPKKAVHKNEVTPMPLACIFSDQGATLDSGYPVEVPGDLEDFWSVTDTAILFKDVEYGQWGLEIFSPVEVLVQNKSIRDYRPGQFMPTDLIIGRFLGDADLLVASTDMSDGISIALPIDPRKEWPRVATDFYEFLMRYLEAQGAKYWER
jgi:hypothetical protein